MTDGRWLPGVDDAADDPRPRPDARTHDVFDGEPVGLPPRFPPPLPLALPACGELLRRAGEELRRLPVEVRVAGLARVARSWLDPIDPLRQEAIESLPAEVGLSADMVAWGLDRAFEVITADALRSWWAGEGGPTTLGLSGHVFAGNVFVAGLPPVFASILAGVPALVKSPGALPSFAVLLARSLALHAPELGPCLGVASWSRADEASTQALVDSVDALFVFGDDETVEAFAGRGPVHGFGHRYSVGWIQDEPSDADLAGLALDAVAWDGAGCLTPRWVFVAGGAERAQALAERAVAAMEAASVDLPAGPMGEGEGARRASWLGVEAVTGWCRSGPGWAVSARMDARLEPAPPGRTLCFVPVPDAASLARVLSPLGPRLQGLALVGGAAARQELERLLAPLGLSRIAAPGRLQVPELAWNHDDVAILPALC